MLTPASQIWQIVLGSFFLAIYSGSMTTMAQSDPETKTIVFLGDSITQSGAGPGGYIPLLEESLKKHYPTSGYKLVGAGISGNKVPDIQARLDRDVLVHNPDLVVIYIGINDVWHSSSGNGTPIDQYETGLRDVVGRVVATGSKVLLCTPSVIGEKTSGSNDLDQMLDEYAAVSRKVAIENSVNFFDLRQAFFRELKIRNSDNAERGVLTTDGVHLNGAGNQFVCDCLRPIVQSVMTGRWLRHLVLFRYKDTATLADINLIGDEFAALRDKIDLIQGFESGVDISPENLSQGYRHCFMCTFADAASRDAYLVHQAHQDFVKLLGPHLDSALVVDFWGSGN